MGGPCSPLLWSIAFDPMIRATERAAGAAAPTYVDDMALLARGPRHAEVGFLATVAAARAAGLRIEGRVCPGPRCAPPELARAIATWADPACMAAVIPTARPCGCKTETTVVPGGMQRALAGRSRRHPAQVRLGRLGGAVPGRHGKTARGAPPSQTVALRGTWGHPCGTVAHTRGRRRAACLLRRPRTRVELYIVPCIHYPARAVAIDKDAEAALASAARNFAGTAGWAHLFLAPALGVLFTVRRAPRCPLAEATTDVILSGMAERIWRPTLRGRSGPCAGGSRLRLPPCHHGWVRHDGPLRDEAPRSWPPRARPQAGPSLH